ncbi:MAG: hypothetical protein IPP93_11715 [Chitinophagaceae bacterium]|nr:hypothetical protein [Chitinophagaceae bacterium]
MRKIYFSLLTLICFLQAGAQTTHRPQAALTPGNIVVYRVGMDLQH